MHDLVIILILIIPPVCGGYGVYRFARWHLRWHRAHLAKARASRDAYLVRHGYPP